MSDDKRKTYKHMESSREEIGEELGFFRSTTERDHAKHIEKWFSKRRHDQRNEEEKKNNNSDK